MPHLTAAQRVLASKLVFVNFLQGTNERGEKEYCYFAVVGDRMQELQQALSRGGPVDPEQFGYVLATGPGDPTPEVRERMEREYGYNHKNQLPILIEPPQEG